MAGFAGDEQDPFLFFRRLDGHVTWWSLARCRAELASPPSAEAPGPAEPLEFLATLATGAEAAAPAARTLLDALGAPSGRDIWISSAPLAEDERTLATAALLGGWAVFRDPAEALHPATLAWARPTLVSGDDAALAALAAGLGALAPRWRRQRWLRQRLGRLRAWIVTGGAPDEQIASHLQALAPGARLVPLRSARSPASAP